MTPEQMQRFRNAIKDNKVDFYFIPSGKMKIKLLEKQDDILNKLPASMITSILSCGPGDGFLIESSLVTKYLDGSLDSNNAYFLSLGEIRVGGIIDMVL